MKYCHVCMLSTKHHALDTRIFLKEALSLKRHGYKVSVIALHDKAETINGVQIIPLRRQPNRFYRFFISFWEIFFRALKTKADIFHFHDPDLMLAGIFLKISGKKVICDIHENFAKNILHREWIKPKNTRKIYAFCYQIFEKIITVFFDGNIVVLDSWISKYRNCIAVRNLPIIFEQSCFPSVPRKNQIIYIGCLTSKRGALEMLKGFQILSQKKPFVSLIIIGYWSNKALECECSTIIRNNPNIHFFGYLPFNLSIEHIRSSKLGLCLYTQIEYEENLPVKMYEYLSLGTPVLCSDFPSWKELTQKEGWGITAKPDDYIEIAQKMEFAMQETEFKKMHVECMKNRKRYSWVNEEKKLLTFYNHLAGTPEL